MKVLVIGSGECVKRDLAIARNRWEFDRVIGVNSAAIDFGPVDFHCSLHAKEYAPIKAAHFVSHKHWRGVDEIFPCMWGGSGTSGSSGLYGVKYALQRLHADMVILAGIPMDVSPHYNRPSAWHSQRYFVNTWKQHADELIGKVYSLSGWTAELLNGGKAPPV